MLVGSLHVLATHSRVLLQHPRFSSRTGGHREVPAPDHRRKGCVPPCTCIRIEHQASPVLPRLWLWHGACAAELAARNPDRLAQFDECFHRMHQYKYCSPSIVRGPSALRFVSLVRAVLIYSFVLLRSSSSS